MAGPSWRQAFIAWAAGGAALMSLSLVANHASAGGLFFTDRGVRPMGRGGAFVAGADDLGAIFFNPAGLVHAKRQVLADLSTIIFQTQYTRTARVRQFDPNTGEPTGRSWNRTYPTSKGKGPLIPIPTLAVSHDFGQEHLAVALGVWSPYAASASYEKKVAGEPNPGRYMLLNLDGSTLVVPGLWGAYQLTPALSVGAGIEVLTGKYRSEVVVNSCLPDRWFCAPESVDYDAYTLLNVEALLAPSANFGVMFDPHENIRLGASFQLPFHIDSPATINFRIPSAAVYHEAYQQGDSARVEMDFPWVARVGTELRLPQFRSELAFVYEAWSMHDEIIVTPENLVLRNVVTFPENYRVSPQTVVRNFTDTYSIRLGAETWFDVASHQLDLRAGVMWEKSAIPDEYVSTLTIDLDKIVLGVGGSLHVTPNWRFDWMLAHAFTQPVDLASKDARYEMLTPLRANKPDPEDRHYVNGGHYEANATIVGLGIAVNYL
ncbi:MAG: hypothetical protein CSA75_02360 [Sorangium cellulosum]|nr:MAG: hypothetical protein CSA75_02360 [Sorangium cellulosum]